MLYIQLFVSERKQIAVMAEEKALSRNSLPLFTTKRSEMEIDMKKDDCIFCKIANGEIPSKTLYEDEEFRVILDLGPAAKGHALILPKDHYANLYELPDEKAAKVMVLAKKMATQVRDKLNCDGYNLVQNNGEIAGQTVFHFHMHLIPRYEDDGQKIGWVPGEPTQEELEAVKEQIIG